MKQITNHNSRALKEVTPPFPQFVHAETRRYNLQSRSIICIRHKSKTFTQKRSFQSTKNTLTDPNLSPLCLTPTI